MTARRIGVWEGGLAAQGAWQRRCISMGEGGATTHDGRQQHGKGSMRGEERSIHRLFRSNPSPRCVGHQISRHGGRYMSLLDLQHATAGKVSMGA